MKSDWEMMSDRERIINSILIGVACGSLVYAALVIAFNN